MVARLGRARLRLPPQAGGGDDPHAHFDYLSGGSHGHTVETSVSLRTEAEIETWWHGNDGGVGDDGTYDGWDKPGERPGYDAVHDAVKWPFDGAIYSYSDGQIRIDVDTGDPAESLIMWEVKFHSNWAPGAQNYLKTFQLRDSTSPNHTLTIGDRPDQNRIVWSTQGADWSVAVDNDNQDIPGAPTISYNETWIRWWYWVDMANDEIAVWYAVEGDESPTFLGRASEDPAATAPNVSFTDGRRHFDVFLWEMNASEGNNPEDTVDRPVWGRNFVHIRNVTFSEAQALLAHASASQF